MNQREMPRYKCLNVVHALKISHIKHRYQDKQYMGATLRFEGEGFDSIDTPPSFGLGHDLHVGGYYVVYWPGYKTYLPAEDFKEGYTRIFGHCIDVSRHPPSVAHAIAAGVHPIKVFRDHKGWTQRGLAMKSCCAQNTIWSAETRIRKPYTRTLQKIAKALDVEVRDLQETGAK